jgi:hypothetical protein
VGSRVTSSWESGAMQRNYARQGALPRQGPRRIHFYLALCVLLAGGTACSRRAEIADEPDSGIDAPPVPMDDAGLSSVDAGFDGGGFVECSARPVSTQCTGANDFPCNFRAWVSDVVTDCQTGTGCTSNGRVLVHMGTEGCVADVEMSEPNEVFVSCIAERFGAVRCPCTTEVTEENLGYFNDGCPDAGPKPCGTGEIRCPNGLSCVEGYCQSESVGAGGGPG